MTAAEFRARPGRFLPGSLTAEGAVVDHAGEINAEGPCFVDLRKLKGRRRDTMRRVGWSIVRAENWPCLPPRRGLQCIQRAMP